MKKVISAVLLLTIILSIAIPINANALGKVSGLKQVGATKDSVTLKWNIVPGADVYEIQVSENNMKYFAATRTDIPMGKVIWLNPGMTYYFRIRAIRLSTGDDDDAYSSTIKGVTTPNSVSEIVQTGASTKAISIRWGKAYGATSYKICRWINNKEYTLGKTKATHFTVRNLNNKANFKGFLIVKSMKSSKTFTAEEKYDAERIEKMKYASVIPSKSIVMTPTRQVAPVCTAADGNHVNFEAQKVPYATHSEIWVKGRSKCVTGHTNKRGNLELANYSVPKNTFFKVRSRAISYLRYKKEWKEGSWSSANYAAICDKPEAKANDKQIVLQWQPVKGATSYSVYTSTIPFFGTQLSGKTKRTHMIISKHDGRALSRNTNYFIYVVANKKVGNLEFQSVKNPMVIIKTK